MITRLRAAGGNGEQGMHGLLQETALSIMQHWLTDNVLNFYVLHL